jgi:hypothetical protein
MTARAAAPAGRPGAGFAEAMAAARRALAQARALEATLPRDAPPTAEAAARVPPLGRFSADDGSVHPSLETEAVFAFAGPAVRVEFYADDPRDGAGDDDQQSPPEMVASHAARTLLHADAAFSMLRTRDRPT